MRKSALQPRSRKTPSGGKMMARRILHMSLAVNGMVVVVVVVVAVGWMEGWMEGWVSGWDQEK